MVGAAKASLAWLHVRDVLEELGRVSTIRPVPKLVAYCLPHFGLVWVLHAAGDGGDRRAERRWALWNPSIPIVHIAQYLRALQLAEKILLCERVVERVAHRAWDAVGERLASREMGARV